MQHHAHATLVDSQMKIQAQVCPEGHVYLYVGHTCLFLRQDEFQDVAQMVYAVESYLLEEASEVLGNPSH